MNRKTRILCLLLAAVMCLAVLAGCGTPANNSDNSSNTNNSSNTDDSGSSNTVPEPDAGELKRIKIPVFAAWQRPVLVWRTEAFSRSCRC